MGGVAGQAGQGAGGAAGDAQCVFGGRTYAHGESFVVNCNTCTCDLHGDLKVSCGMMLCLSDAGAFGGASSAVAATGGMGGTGGQPSAGTGGQPSAGTGGQPSAGTGGQPSAGTGGQPSIGTGGAGGATTVCGHGLPDLLSAFGRIAPNEWKVDITPPNMGSVKVASTYQGVEDLIDGAAADFFASPYNPLFFGMQFYFDPFLPSPYGSTDNRGAELKLYVLQMPSAAQAAGLYKSLLSTSLYRAGGTVWEPLTVPVIGDGARISNTGGDWWINFYRCNYYVEVRLTPSYGPPPDYAENDPKQKAGAIAFASAVAAAL
jgi:hypothetical protein